MAKTEYIHYILEIYTFIRINPFKSYIKNIEKQHNIVVLKIMHWNLRSIHPILIPIYKSTPYGFIRMNSQIPQNVLILFSSTLVMDPLVADMMNSNLTKKSVDAFFFERGDWLLDLGLYCFCYSVFRS